MTTGYVIFLWPKAGGTAAMAVVITPSSSAGVLPHAHPMPAALGRPLCAPAVVHRPSRPARPRPAPRPRPSRPPNRRRPRPPRPHPVVRLLRPDRFAGPPPRSPSRRRALRTAPGTPGPRAMAPRRARVRTAPLAPLRRRTVALLLVRLPRPPGRLARRLQPPSARPGATAAIDPGAARRPGWHQRRSQRRAPPPGQRGHAPAPSGATGARGPRRAADAPPGLDRADAVRPAAASRATAAGPRNPGAAASQ